MRLRYENALGIMCNCDEELSGLINQFVDNFPESLVKKIDSRRENGTTIKEDKRWEFADNGREFSLSMGDAKKFSKDYMNLYLTAVSSEDMALWPRFDGERLIGYITFFLYPKEGREKPTQATYEFYAKKVEKDVIVKILPSANSEIKEVGERLKNYGLDGIQQRVLNRKYKVNTKEILENNRTSSR